MRESRNELRDNIIREYGDKLHKLFIINCKNDDMNEDYDQYIDNLVDMIINDEITIEEIFWKEIEVE